MNKEVDPGAHIFIKPIYICKTSFYRKNIYLNDQTPQYDLKIKSNKKNS